jgi:hypothetical protein
MKSAYFAIHTGRNPPPQNGCRFKSGFFSKSTGFTSSIFPFQPDFSQNQPAAITLNTGSPRTLLHTHPLATETLLVIKGSIYTGFISDDNVLYPSTLQVGDLTIFPKGTHISSSMLATKRPSHLTPSPRRTLNSSRQRIRCLRLAFQVQFCRSLSASTLRKWRASGTLFLASLVNYVDLAIAILTSPAVNQWFGRGIEPVQVHEVWFKSK